MTRVVLACLVLIVVDLSSRLDAQEPPATANEPATPELSPEAKEKLAERDRLMKEAEKLAANGKPAEVAAKIELVAAIEREVLGPESPELDSTLETLQSFYLQAEDFDAAAGAADAWLSLRVRLYRDDDWRTTDAHLARKQVEIERGLTGDQRAELRRAKVLHSQVAKLRREGHFGEAIKLARQVMDIRRRILGEEHPDYATSLNDLALLYNDMGDNARALRLFEQALAIRKKALGEDHPDYAQSLNNLASLYHRLGDHARALPLYEQTLAIRKKALGEEHLDYATSLDNLASLYHDMGDSARTLPLYEQALAIRKKALGQDHFDYATSLINLAKVYRTMGNSARALPLYEQALAITKKALGEEHPHYASSLDNLAALYRDMGDDARALPLYEQALAIWKSALGEEHPEYATSLNNLAGLYYAMGDHARAVPLYEQALAIREKTLGQEHFDYATSLINLAKVYRTMGNSARALPLYERALAIWKKSLGEEHPQYAVSLSNLGALYHTVGDHARALPLYEQALAIWKKSLGEEHPNYATSLNNLALLFYDMGHYARALPLFEQALAIRKKALGEEHPDYATSLSNLAALYRDMGNDAHALPLFEKAIIICRRQLELTSAVQSERQQIAALGHSRYVLDQFLALALAAGAHQRAAYRHALVWKGATLARQRSIRALAGRPELAETFAQLQSAASRLANLYAATPGPEQHEVWQRQLDELITEKERLEAQLAAASGQFRAAFRAVTLEAVVDALPKGAALVDYLEFDAKDGPHLAAFVVRPGPEGPHVALHDLGPAEAVGKLIGTWREGPYPKAGDDPDLGQSPQAQAAAAELKKTVWDPLLGNLAGIKLVLVSADGALGAFPLAALPGEQPGSYLIEDESLRLTVVAAPQLLPELLADASTLPLPEGDEAGASANLLLIGHVDYDKRGATLAQSSPVRPFGRRDVRWDGRAQFDPLEGSRGEMLAIEDTYRNAFGESGLTRLAGAAATEEEFLQAAPRHAHLHIATHGYFAPPPARPAQRLEVLSEAGQRDFDVAGMSPGLLSGLALAGANLRPDEEHGDGILSAEEVATLDLSRCRVCVLSACETGLGTAVTGEGLLGLQRAFQVAGARTTIASFWKVPDQATRALMERFYVNLWEKQLPTLDALREAQLWMLREGRTRGPALEQAQKLPPGGRLPPYYWAAFVLSGDWR